MARGRHKLAAHFGGIKIWLTASAHRAHPADRRTSVRLNVTDVHRWGKWGPQSNLSCRTLYVVFLGPAFDVIAPHSGQRPVVARKSYPQHEHFPILRLVNKTLIRRHERGFVINNQARKTRADVAPIVPRTKRNRRTVRVDHPTDNPNHS
jgi:hypothetical protein